MSHVSYVASVKFHTCKLIYMSIVSSKKLSQTYAICESFIDETIDSNLQVQNLTDVTYDI